MERSVETPVVYAPVVGVVAFAVGYALTLGVTVVGERATLVSRNNPEAAGWVYYNSQLANVVATGSGGWTDVFGGERFNLLTQFLWNQPRPRGQPIAAGEFLSGAVPTAVYHLIPVVVLAVAGFLFVRIAGVETVWGAITASISIAFGTAIAAAAGTVLFTVDAGGLVVAPSLLEGVLMVGLFFPMAVAPVGGVVATRL
jgi:hypothetical protein